MPSLLPEIGEIIKRHWTGLGVMNAEPDPHLQAWLAEKRQQLHGP